MAYKFSQRSLDKLKGVHPDLVKVVHRALELTDIDFAVIEGLRTVERQKELLQNRATTTMRSRHLTGHAVDIAAVIGKEIRWDWPLYSQLAHYMKAAARELNIPIEWGGDWTTFKDGPHYQLPWKDYPA